METVGYNEVLQALSPAKSVRVYTDEPVAEAERNAVYKQFQAPRRATSSCTRTLNITDPALKARLAIVADATQPFIARHRWCGVSRCRR